MRLIDADKIDFSEVFIGASDFAKDTREAAQMLIDHQPTAYDVEKVVEVLDKESVYTDNLDIDLQFVELKEAIDIVRKGGVE